jgi:hypothetical protein
VKAEGSSHILSQINPIHTTLSYVSKICLNIILPFTSRSAWWPLSLWISNQNPVCIPLLPHSCYMPCSSHPPWLDHSKYTWWRVQVLKLLIIQFSPTSLTYSLFGPNILLSTLFSDTLSLCSSLNVRNQVSHPYRTTGKIVVLLAPPPTPKQEDYTCLLSVTAYSVYSQLPTKSGGRLLHAVVKRGPSNVAVISLSSFNGLVFVMEMQCVFYEVRSLLTFSYM